MTAKKYAILNQKGGVGKTTTAFHLSRAAVLAGKKVLLIDVDPQGSLTLISAQEGSVEEGQVGLADVLSKRTPETIEAVTVPGIWENLFLVPTTGESLGDVRDELVISGAGREIRLREALKPVLEMYDYIFLDCPPSLDQLTINALTAADEVIVVSESKLLSAAGLAKLLDTVEVVRGSYNPNLKIGGVILNKHEEQTISGRQWRSEIADAHTVLEPPMPKAAMISDSAEAATGLDVWPGGPRAQELFEIYSGYLVALEGEKA